MRFFQKFPETCKLLHSRLAPGVIDIRFDLSKVKGWDFPFELFFVRGPRAHAGSRPLGGVECRSGHLLADKYAVLL